MTANDRILKIHQVTQITGLTHNEIDQQINDGLFPKPLKLNKKTVWLKSQIDEWLQKQSSQTKLKKFNFEQLKEFVSLFTLLLKIHEILQNILESN